MERNLKQKAEMMAANAARRQTWKRLIILPAALVALFTTSMLISPALAFAGEPACGKEEHAHSDACYERVLTCTEPTDAVEGEAGPEAAHVHTDACYTKELTCTLEEHAHDESCYAAKPAPQSEEKAQDGTAPEPVCGLAEHAHTEDCYDETGVLTCGLDEHTHDETCLPKPEPENPEDPGDTATSETAAPETAAEPTEDAVTPETATPETATPETAEKAGPKTLEVTDHNVRISVTFGPEAGLPDNVQLVATEITPASDPDQFDSFVAQAEETLGESIAPVAAADEPAAIDLEEEAETPALPMLLYNIGFYADGVEVEPQAPVAVTVQFLDAEGFPVGDEMSVLHFAADGVEQLANQTSAENNTASFTAGSFSPFAFFQQASEAAENEEKKEEEEEKKQPDAEVKTGSDTAEDDEKEPGTVTGGDDDKETDTKEDKEEEGKEEKKEDAGAKTPQTPAAYTPVNGFDLGFILLYPNNTVTLAEDLETKLENGEEVSLAGSITISSTIDIKKSATLDLNGHTITYNGSGSLFEVTGGTLTVKDSVTQPGTDTREATAFNTNLFLGENGGAYDAIKGWLASWDGTTLTYYTTVPVANVPGYANNVMIGTSDTRYVNTVGLSGVGAITSTTASSLIKISGGKVEIEGGRFTNTNGQAICTPDDNKSNASIDLKGGYFCGNGKRDTGSKSSMNGQHGGAIYYSGNGEVHIGGHTVIAANFAQNGGGVYIGSTSGLYNGTRAKLTVDGNAVISGNLADGEGDSSDFSDAPGWGGGGMYVVSAKPFTISGDAYITNNYSSGDVHGTTENSENLLRGCNDQGGGGIFYTGNGTFTINGGYITGNHAWNVGGGIAIREDYTDKGTTFKIRNGFISSNVANFREGGGIWMSSYVDAEAQVENDTQRIYVTNNETHTNRDWGGGGIFIHGESGRMKMYRTLITNNTAEGYGGGVGGCSTGRLFVSGEEKNGANKGVAIYENKAEGIQTTDSLKSDDHTAAQKAVFTSNGYQDYFSALVSRITGTMLGGGDAAWQGSMDYNPVEIHDTDVKEATEMAGLTNHSSLEDRIRAEKEAAVFMSGNYSTMHGGAIMCNGILQFGDDDKHEYPLGMDINGLKSYSGTMLAGDFTFVLDQKENGEWKTINEAANYDSDGHFSLALKQFPGMGPNWKENDEKTFYYRMTEKEEKDKNPNITYDTSTKYYIDVTVKKVKVENSQIGGSANGNNDPDHTYYTYKIIGVTVKKNDTTLTRGTDYTLSHYTTSEDENTTDYRLRTVLSFKNTTFTNSGTKSPKLHIRKLDANTGEPVPLVTFTLKKEDGTLVDSQKTGNGKYNKGYTSFALPANGNYYLYEDRGEANKFYEEAGPWLVVVSGESVDVFEMTGVTYKADGNVDHYEKGAQVAKSIEGVKIDSTNTTVYPHLIYNQPREETELPETGGSGTMAYTVSGLALLAMAAWVYGRRRSAANR